MDDQSSEWGRRRAWLSRAGAERFLALKQDALHDEARNWDGPAELLEAYFEYWWSVEGGMEMSIDGAMASEAAPAEKSNHG